MLYDKLSPCNNSNQSGIPNLELSINSKLLSIVGINWIKWIREVQCNKSQYHHFKKEKLQERKRKKKKKKNKRTLKDLNLKLILAWIQRVLSNTIYCQRIQPGLDISTQKGATTSFLENYRFTNPNINTTQ